MIGFWKRKKGDEDKEGEFFVFCKQIANFHFENVYFRQLLILVGEELGVSYILIDM